ncbi:MAG: hypothetical protein E7288_03695 [Lachnospiraceae bacterium]|nr:hypothetical protein [Lachnospiraceae bacterium]
MNVEIEKIANSLKGVASVLSTMSEVPEGSMIWNEWALHLLYKELDENIKKLEEIASGNNAENEDEENEEE